MSPALRKPEGRYRCVTNYEKDGRKQLILMRGLPGSGKTKTAIYLCALYAAIDGTVVGRFSTDDYWGPNYNFDAERLPDAHEWNQRNAELAISRGMNVVIIDNTNVTDDAMAPYCTMARNNGYTVYYVEPDTAWHKAAMEAVSAMLKAAIKLRAKNTHNVPITAIMRMMANWSCLEDDNVIR